MITDEQIESVAYVIECNLDCSRAEVQVTGNYLNSETLLYLASPETQIQAAIAAERNRLLDECLGICDMKMSEVLLACGELSRQEIRTVQAVLDMLKCKVEALRHE